MSLFDMAEEEVKRICGIIAQDAIERVTNTLIPAALTQAESLEFTVEIPPIKIKIARK
jgi:5,10-methenyltetrahydromethanopterin hydrogenase